MRRLCSAALVAVIFFTVAICGGCGSQFKNSNVSRIFGVDDNSSTIFFNAKNAKITFMVDNSTYKTVSVEKGSTVNRPSDPVKHNYIFRAWTVSGGRDYDFSSAVSSDITLYADFVIDGATITNEITRNQIRSVFTVKAISSKTEYPSWDIFKLSPKTYTYTSQGSGTVFHKSGKYYYVLTNCHVVKNKSGYPDIEYEVTDYQGKTYTAYLYRNPNKSSSAIKAEYDLACVYFTTNNDYPAIGVVSSDPAVGTDVIALGSPHNQTNAISFGKLNDYQTIEVQGDKSSTNVTFPVIRHDAYISNGSSGGPILNADYKIIGVNYAGNDTGRGYSIPPSKINEFLKAYVYD